MPSRVGRPSGGSHATPWQQLAWDGPALWTRSISHREPRRRLPRSGPAATTRVGCASGGSRGVAGDVPATTQAGHCGGSGSWSKSLQNLRYTYGMLQHDVIAASHSESNAHHSFNDREQVSCMKLGPQNHKSDN